VNPANGTVTGDLKKRTRPDCTLRAASFGQGRGGNSSVRYVAGAGKIAMPAEKSGVGQFDAHTEKIKILSKSGRRPLSGGDENQCDDKNQRRTQGACLRDEESRSVFELTPYRAIAYHKPEMQLETHNRLCPALSGRKTAQIFLNRQASFAGSPAR